MSDERFLAVTYPLGGNLDMLVGPELVKTRDYLHFDLAFPTRGYFALPKGYIVLVEYPVGLSATQALRKFVRHFPLECYALGEQPPRSAGWIAPNGDFYPGRNGHYTLAQYITAALWAGPAGEEFLDEHGWCRIHYTGQVTPPQASYKQVTLEQAHAARALLHTNNDPDWQEALRAFIYAKARAKQYPREAIEEFLSREAGA